MEQSEKKPILIIRADAGSQMGTGHVMRCLGLAQAWREKGGKAEFFCAGTPLRRLAAEGFPAKALQADPGSMEDARETAIFAKTRLASWIVLDGYHFKEDFQKFLMDAGIKTLVVDDNQDCNFYHAHIVVNPNLHAQESMFSSREIHTRLLLGPQYAFLRKEFWQASKESRDFSRNSKRVLVTLGGADPNNTTLKVIRALGLNRGLDLEIKVLIGQSNPHMQSLEEEAQHVNGLELIRDAKNMAELMAWADLAVSAAGSTCWEMAACGLPGILIVLAENQRNIGKTFHQAGAGINLGWHGSVTESAIWSNLKVLAESQEMQKRMSLAASTVTDGLGAQKTARIMMDSL
ncbi:MAG: UDP-2,4-diacetamido-2,4,6-trideoxy-beta-L-altropyranose hydrolase [Desulfatibacillum sp.]|nr:UDP-2,4-diacetamido-2,4,6-trideoxy-beta-L-altropyranose hydrolase [Desulfatibacillum sp.]